MAGYRRIGTIPPTASVPSQTGAVPFLTTVLRAASALCRN
jgi:hypothetical protein